MSDTDFNMDTLMGADEFGYDAFAPMDNPYFNYLKGIAQSIPGGANIIGDISARSKALYDLVGIENSDHIFAVGDRRTNFGDKDNPLNVDSALPINYDIWYLYWAGNILLNGRHTDYTTDEWLEETLEKLEDYISTIDSTEQLKCLKQPAEDRNTTNDGLNTFTAMPEIMNSDIAGDWKYTIKEARFETLIKPLGGANAVILNTFTANKMPYWPSKEGVYDSTDNPPDPLYGVKEPDRDGYCGYIAFPVGPSGVMWRTALATESSLDTEFSTGAGVFPATDPTGAIQAGGELLPPFELNRSEMAGERLTDKGYLVTDDSVVELLPPEKFDEVDNYALHYWMRYWIRKDNVTIIPGELCCLMVRPWPLHCWFYQESSPFLYAGNWLETEFYASGIVKSVLEPWVYEDYEARSPSMPSQDDEAEDGYYDPHEEAMDFHIGSKLYRVWVKNEEIIVESSDFKEYEAGDRVGLLKGVRDGNETDHVNASGPVELAPGPGDNFDWQGLKWWKLKGKNTEDEDIYIRDWVITPVNFYGATGGNSVGGA